MASHVSTGSMMLDAITRPASGLRPVAYQASGLPTSEGPDGQVVAAGAVLASSIAGSILSGLIIGAIVGAIRSCDSYRPRE